ncbi:MAG: cytochrome c [Thermoguttaceae bacterium]
MKRDASRRWRVALSSRRRWRLVMFSSRRHGGSDTGWANAPSAAEQLLLVALVVAAGCQQKMADQPSYRPLEPSAFFADGRSERPPVAGTVARGRLQTDVALWTGRRTDKNGEPRGVAAPVAIQPKPDSPQEAKARKAQYDDFDDTFPMPMTRETLERGHRRYTIYCIVCHDPLGTGHGKIVERGYTAPPSYHTERLRRVPAGYLFAVISEGYGSMPSYAEQIPLGDRWAIAGYLRALQTSQHFHEPDSPRRLEEGPGVTAGHGRKGVDTGAKVSKESPHPNPLPKGEGAGDKILPKGEGTDGKILSKGEGTGGKILSKGEGTGETDAGGPR